MRDLNLLTSRSFHEDRSTSNEKKDGRSRLESWRDQLLFLRIAVIGISRNASQEIVHKSAK